MQVKANGDAQVQSDRGVDPIEVAPRSPEPPSSGLPLANLLLLLGTLLFTSALSEVFLRLSLGAWPFEPGEEPVVYLTERDAELKWRFSAKDGRNSLGLKNREITPKEQDVIRILFLGDSLIWVSETSSGELFTQVIEANLNRAQPGDQKIEVINAGVPGYTTYQDLQFLKVYGLEMEPDIVVLGFVFNDLYYKYLHRLTAENVLATIPEARRHRFDVGSFPGVFFGKSYLAHELTLSLQKISRKLGAKNSFSFEYRDDFYLAWKRYGWAHTDRLIGEMQELLLGKGIPLTLLVFPVVDQVDQANLDLGKDYVLYPQRRIREIAENYQTGLVDLTEPITQGGGPELFVDYLHLNEAGNDIVAEVMTRVLLESVSSEWAVGTNAAGLTFEGSNQQTSGMTTSR